jgi:hypothetical protein
MPKRIQRKRTKNWKMPPNSVYVGRPSKWGNPIRVTENVSHERAVGEFRRIIGGFVNAKEFLAPLRGKDLVCWCKLSEPCHADVLLEIANS